MERTGKYEKFPILEAGDVVVCGEHTAYLVIGKGGYMLRDSSNTQVPADLCTYITNIESLLDSIGGYSTSKPMVVFRPSEGFIIPTGVISTALTDWRLVRTDNDERFERIWSIDDDDAKELTVDEVSKLLGYKVKIVGAKN